MAELQGRARAPDHQGSATNGPAGLAVLQKVHTHGLLWSEFFERILRVPDRTASGVPANLEVPARQVARWLAQPKLVQEVRQPAFARSASAGQPPPAFISGGWRPRADLNRRPTA